VNVKVRALGKCSSLSQTKLDFREICDDHEGRRGASESGARSIHRREDTDSSCQPSTTLL
jgi:hypothetical protein